MFSNDRGYGRHYSSPYIEPYPSSDQYVLLYLQKLVENYFGNSNSATWNFER